VHTLAEFFAVARALEKESAHRYAELARKANDEGLTKIAQLFSRLAEEEEAHVREVVNWSENLGATAEGGVVIADLPAIFDDETGGDLASSQLATQYRVLSMAVRNEERAFAFWSFIASRAESPEIRNAAEQMAREELEHVALLRSARRQAYHAERRTRSLPESLPLSARLAEAACLERGLAEQLDDLSGRQVAGAAGHMRELAAEARRMADEVALLAKSEAPSGSTTLPPLEAAERLVEDYITIGDIASDEAMVSLVQSLAARAVARLVWLRALG
jgi:rubrerythrin